MKIWRHVSLFIRWRSLMIQGENPWGFVVKKEKKGCLRYKTYRLNQYNWNQMEALFAQLPRQNLRLFKINKNQLFQFTYYGDNYGNALLERTILCKLDLLRRIKIFWFLKYSWNWKAPKKRHTNNIPILTSASQVITWIAAVKAIFCLSKPFAFVTK